MDGDPYLESSPEETSDGNEPHESGLPACINCRRSKVRCEGAELPCKRCIRLCWAATCTRPEPQKRGRKKKSAAGSSEPTPSPPAGPGSKPSSVKKSTKSSKSTTPTTTGTPPKPRKRPAQPLIAHAVAPSAMNFNPIFSPSTDGSVSSGTFQILTPGSGEFCVPSQPLLYPRGYGFEAPHPLRKAYSHSSLLSGVSPCPNSEASSPALSSGSVFSPTFHSDPSVMHQFNQSLVRGDAASSHSLQPPIAQYQQVPHQVFLQQQTQQWDMQQQQLAQQQVHPHPTSSEQFVSSSVPPEFLPIDPMLNSQPTRHMLQTSGAFSSAIQPTPQRMPTDLSAVSPSPPVGHSKVALPPAPEVIQSIFGSHSAPLPQLLLDTSVAPFSSTSSAASQTATSALNSESIVSSFRSAQTIPELIDSDDIVAVPKSHTRAIHPRYSAFRRSCQENVEQFGFLESHFNTWRNVVSSDHTMYSDRSAVLRFLWFASHVSLVVHDFCVLNGIDLNVTSLRHPALPTASSALFSIVPSDAFGQPLGPIYPKPSIASSAHATDPNPAAASTASSASDSAVVMRSSNGPSVSSSSAGPSHSGSGDETERLLGDAARNLLQKVEREDFLQVVQNRGVPLIRLLEKPQFQAEFKQLAQMFMRHVFRGVDAVLQMASPHLEGELSFPVVESGGGFQFAVEKQAFKQLPMGVIAIPLFPRPFVPDRGKATPVYAWANRNACALLGYQPEEMAELLSTRDGFLSLCHPGTYFEVSRRFCHALTHHIKQLTFVSDWIHKSGKSISLVGTRWFKYDQGLPILQIIFLQPLPTTVIPPFEMHTHRPRSPHAYSFSTMSPRSDGHDHEHDHEHEHETHSVAASPHVHGEHEESHHSANCHDPVAPGSERTAVEMSVDPISHAIDLYSTTYTSLTNSNGQVDTSLASSIDASTSSNQMAPNAFAHGHGPTGSSDSLPSLTGGLLSQPPSDNA